MSVFYKDGSYSGEIMDIAFDEDVDGNAKIVIKVKVLHTLDVTTNDWVPCSAQYDRTIWLNVPEEEEHKKYVVMKLRNAGWQGDSFESLRSELLSKCVNLVNRCRQATKGKYTGQTVEGWDLPLPDRESKPLENKPQVAKKLNALFGKVLKENKMNAVPVATAAQIAAEPAVDSEVPF